MTKEEKAKHVWICLFCGTPYEHKKEAEQCWEAHSELTVDYVWGGIGSGSDMPKEVIIKKNERGYITEIATYTLEGIRKVKMRERKIVKKE